MTLFGRGEICPCRQCQTRLARGNGGLMRNGEVVMVYFVEICPKHLQWMLQREHLELLPSVLVRNLLPFHSLSKCDFGPGPMHGDDHVVKRIICSEQDYIRAPKFGTQNPAKNQNMTCPASLCCSTYMGTPFLICCSYSYSSGRLSCSGLSWGISRVLFFERTRKC